jgi:hypothetical protein
MTDHAGVAHYFATARCGYPNHSGPHIPRGTPQLPGNSSMGTHRALHRAGARSVQGVLAHVTTFWLSFGDPFDEKFLGVVIFDVDESERRLSAPEIVKVAHKRGLIFGRQVCIQAVESVPDEHKNQLLADEALVLKLGAGRSKWSITLPTLPYIDGFRR